jgi:DNA-binding beta-propeller fold protein YncE
MHRTLARLRAATVALLALPYLFAPAAAELAVSANDGKVRLVDGKVEVVKDGRDTVTIIDLAASPPKAIAEIDAPASVIGPPLSVAISPAADIALVTGAMKIDPADPTKQIPDDKLSVIELPGSAPALASTLTPATEVASAEAPKAPQVIATLQAGKGAAGVSINKAGTLALVANRNEGTISVFSVDGKRVEAVGEKVRVGDDKSGPSHVVFSPDGKMALVTMDGENSNKIAVLSIDGTKVEYTKRDMNAGLRPYGIDMSSNGDVAVVANIGRGQGDADTISIIDMKAAPPRVVSTVTVGQTPEGIKLSPDGRYVAITVMNGTNKPANSPFFNANGLLQVYRRTGTELSKVVEAPVGKWCQGVAWNQTSSVILAQCMVEHEILAFNFSDSRLQKIGVVKTTAGPAAIRTVEK